MIVDRSPLGSSGDVVYALWTRMHNGGLTRIDGEEVARILSSSAEMEDSTCRWTPAEALLCPNALLPGAALQSWAIFFIEHGVRPLRLRWPSRALVARGRSDDIEVREVAIDSLSACE
jgi:hypothetical protein